MNFKLYYQANQWSAGKWRAGGSLGCGAAKDACQLAH